MDALNSSDVCLFGPFRFDRRGGVLHRCDADGRYLPVSIGSRARAVLGALIARPGNLVPRDEIMRAAWPGTVVEEGNLAVQISALRRILDAGSTGESCIQTVSGRGYRFVRSVTDLGERSPPEEAARKDNQVEAVTTAGRARTRLWNWLAVGSGAVTIIPSVMAVMWLGGWPARTALPPRLSLVVLPFANLSGDPRDDYLADGITDDVTSDLSHLRSTFVIAHQTAYTYRGTPKNVREIGEELGVRYVLEGSVRRIGSILRVNAQLTSAETGAHLWSDRFDEPITELAAGQEQIVTRMRSELDISMIEIEKARSQRERPTNPDAFDLILRARSLTNLPPNPARSREVLALYERVLQLDPSSAAAMANVAYYLLDPTMTGLGINFTDQQRAERLLRQARTIAPNSVEVLNYLVYWLSSTGRCQEVIEAAQQAIQMDPSQGTGVYNELGKCKIWTGHAEEEIPLQQTANRRNPSVPTSSGDTVAWALHR